MPLAKILEFTPSADALRLVEGIGWADGLVGNGIVGIDQDFPGRLHASEAAIRSS